MGRGFLCTSLQFVVPPVFCVPALLLEIGVRDFGSLRSSGWDNASFSSIQLPPYASASFQRWTVDEHVIYPVGEKPPVTMTEDVQLSLQASWAKDFDGKSLILLILKWELYWCDENTNWHPFSFPFFSSSLHSPHLGEEYHKNHPTGVTFFHGKSWGNSKLFPDFPG